MANLTTTEKQILEKLFQMGGGYVLNFSDRTMGEFFRDDIGINIYDEKYNYASGSKANRIRGFCSVADNKLVGKSILKLVEYIESQILLGELNSSYFTKDLINEGKKIGQKLFGGDIEIKKQGPRIFLDTIKKIEQELYHKYKENETIKIYLQQWIKYHEEEIETTDCDDRTYMITEKCPNFNIIKNTDGNINLIETLSKIDEKTLLNISKDLSISNYDSLSDDIQKIKNTISEANFSDSTISIILQKEVFEHVKSLLHSGHYFNAVEESYKIVRKKLESITGEEQAHRGFKEDNYTIIFGHEPQHDAEKDFFEGVKFLHMAIQNLRNEKSHTLAKKLDKNLAIHYIVLASLAYDLINRNV